MSHANSSGILIILQNSHLRLVHFYIIPKLFKAKLILVTFEFRMQRTKINPSRYCSDISAILHLIRREIKTVFGELT